MGVMKAKPKYGENLETMASEVADGLLRIALHAGFEAFQDGQFRQQFRWAERGEEGQNRLFNELVVTAIGFLYVHLDDELIPADARSFVANIRQQFTSCYREQLTELGIAGRFVKLWIKLLDMRLAEYQNDLAQYGDEFTFNRAELLHDESLLPEPVYTRVMVIATAALSHLRRGKLDPQDALFAYLKRWLIDIAHQLAPAFVKLRGGADAQEA